MYLVCLRKQVCSCVVIVYVLVILSKNSKCYFHCNIVSSKLIFIQQRDTQWLYKCVILESAVSTCNTKDEHDLVSLYDIYINIHKSFAEETDQFVFLQKNL